MDAHRGYLAAGTFTILASLPGWLALLGGPFAMTDRVRGALVLTVPALAAGALLIPFGMGRLPRNRQSLTALRFSVLGLGFALCLWAALGLLHAGVETFLTIVLFSGMAFSYLSLMTLGFLIAAAVRRRAP